MAPSLADYGVEARQFTVACKPRTGTAASLKDIATGTLIALRREAKKPGEIVQLSLVPIRWLSPLVTSSPAIFFARSVLRGCTRV